MEFTLAEGSRSRSAGASNATCVIVQHDVLEFLQQCARCSERQNRILY
jgi:hypothetical protein